MKVISVVNTKGGSGKSTLATNLAAIAASQGKRVMLIDADGKQASSLSFRQLRYATNEKIKEDNKGKVKSEQKETYAEFTAQSLPSNLIFQEVKTYEASFDYIIIDAGAGDNNIVRSAIAAAAFGILVIPCQPSAYDLFGTTDTLDLLKACRVTLDIDAVIVMNMVFADKRIKILKDVDETLLELTDTYDVERLNTNITNYITYKYSTTKGLSVVEYDSTSKAATEMMDLYNEIMARLEGNDK